MSEVLADPLPPYFDVYKESVGMDLFLSSLPLEDRWVQHKTWRRIVEEPWNVDEFSSCLATLNRLREHGINTPPYSAVIDTYSDGYSQYTLQVGHVEDGLHFDELDFSDPNILKDYEELGKKLLNYFDYCEKAGQSHLTDIARVDQYLYGRNNSMASPKPILVDLELHTGHNYTYYQLDMFHELFIIPLEERSHILQLDLRAHLKTMVDAVDIAQVPGIDSLDLLKLKESLDAPL